MVKTKEQKRTEAEVRQAAYDKIPLKDKLKKAGPRENKKLMKRAENEKTN